MTTATFPLNSREYHTDRAAYHSECAADEANARDFDRAAYHSSLAAYHIAEAPLARPAQTAAEGLAR